MKFLKERDSTDHFAFAPLQTDFAADIIVEYDMSWTIGIDNDGRKDFTSAILIDDEGAHSHATSILRGFRYLGFPYSCLGPIGLCVPRCITDSVYGWVSRHRGQVWKCAKKTFGMADTNLSDYRLAILGVTDFEQAPTSWGLSAISADEAAKTKEAPCSCMGSCGGGYSKM